MYPCMPYRLTGDCLRRLRRRRVGGIFWPRLHCAFGKIGLQFTAAQFVGHGKRQGPDPLPDTPHSVPDVEEAGT